MASPFAMNPFETQTGSQVIDPAQGANTQRAVDSLSGQLNNMTSQVARKGELESQMKFQADQSAANRNAAMMQQMVGIGANMAESAAERAFRADQTDKARQWALEDQKTWQKWQTAQNEAGRRLDMMWQAYEGNVDQSVMMRPLALRFWSLSQANQVLGQIGLGLYMDQMQDPSTQRTLGYMLEKSGLDREQIRNMLPDYSADSNPSSVQGSGTGKTALGQTPGDILTQFMGSTPREGSGPVMLRGLEQMKKLGDTYRTTAASSFANKVPVEGVFAGTLSNGLGDVIGNIQKQATPDANTVANVLTSMQMNFGGDKPVPVTQMTNAISPEMGAMGYDYLGQLETTLSNTLHEQGGTLTDAQRTNLQTTRNQISKVRENWRQSQGLQLSTGRAVGILDPTGEYMKMLAGSKADQKRAMRAMQANIQRGMEELINLPWDDFDALRQENSSEAMAAYLKYGTLIDQAAHRGDGAALDQLTTEYMSQVKAMGQKARSRRKAILGGQ